MYSQTEKKSEYVKAKDPETTNLKRAPTAKDRLVGGSEKE